MVDRILGAGKFLTGTITRIFRNAIHRFFTCNICNVCKICINSFNIIAKNLNGRGFLVINS